MVKIALPKDLTCIVDNVYGSGPSEPGTIVFICLFSLACIVSLAQLIRHGKEICNPIGCAFLFLGTPIIELAGFAVRLPSVLAPFNDGLYLANMIILAIGPLYLAAVNWIVFPALMVWTGPRYFIIRPHRLIVLIWTLLISCIQLTISGTPNCHKIAIY